jgi:hypothetical protein
MNTHLRMLWRGPFTVERDGREHWKIVNTRGETERGGIKDKRFATTECDLMNSAENFCDAEPGADHDKRP